MGARLREARLRLYYSVFRDVLLSWFMETEESSAIHHRFALCITLELMGRDFITRFDYERLQGLDSTPHSLGESCSMAN